MTVPTQSSQATPDNSKELNFRALEAKFQRDLEVERKKVQDLERRFEESRKPVKQAVVEDDDGDDDAEPYVDHRKLNKKLQAHEQKTLQKTSHDIKSAIAQAKEEAKQEAFLDANPDFFDLLQNHAEKLANKSPALAKSILAMPESFERQKLVYQTIKELGLHNSPPKEPSIQEKIDANRRSPFYQPTSVGSPSMNQAVYSPKGTYTQNEMKEAYDKIQDMKNRLRI